MTLQEQYDNIYFYMKSTTEPFDSLDWDGKELLVTYKDHIIERYTFSDLLYLGIKL